MGGEKLPLALVNAPAPVLFIILLPARRDGTGEWGRSITGPTQSAVCVTDSAPTKPSAIHYGAAAQGRAGAAPPQPVHYDKSVVCLFPSLFFFGRWRDRTGRDRTGRDGRNNPPRLHAEDSLKCFLTLQLNFFFFFCIDRGPWPSLDGAPSESPTTNNRDRRYHRKKGGAAPLA